MPEVMFSIPTPLGFSVRTTREYWTLILRKHPEITGKEAEVRRCLREPEQVRCSKQDQAVYLFYRALPPYHLVVVARRLDGNGFIVASYMTDRIKEGEPIWPTSA